MLSNRIYVLEPLHTNEPIMELDRKGFMGWLDENYEGNYLYKLEDIDNDLDVEALVTVNGYGITCNKDGMTNLDRIGQVLQYLRDKKRDLVEEFGIYDEDDEIKQDELVELLDMIHNLELVQDDWWE